MQTEEVPVVPPGPGLRATYRETGKPISDPRNRDHRRAAATMGLRPTGNYDGQTAEQRERALADAEAKRVRRRGRNRASHG